MEPREPFVDIHCHLVPGIDDGSKSWDETLQMARMAVGDGISTIVVTPHQMGTFSHNHGDMIRERTKELAKVLRENDIPLKVLPGGDVRIEPDMISKLRSGEVLTLADRRKHVLLELPHELYFPLEPVLDSLHANGMVGILSHPERNQGILKNPEVLEPLVARGCLMQVTAGSLMGTFGPMSQDLSEWMIEQELVHFLATDAHGPNSRRPLIRRAFQRAAELGGMEMALAACCRNPAAVAAGKDVVIAPRTIRKKKPTGITSWFRWGKAA